MCARVVEVWGKADPEAHALFASMLEAEPKALSEVGEELPLVIDDRTACREALLRGLRADVRCDFLLKGCKNFGVTAEDEEVVRAALQAGTRDMAPLYRDLWSAAIIDAFAAHPDVRKIALDELVRRDGSLGAVANSDSGDEEMCQRVLRALCPLDETRHSSCAILKRPRLRPRRFRAAERGTARHGRAGLRGRHYWLDRSGAGARYGARERDLVA